MSLRTIRNYVRHIMESRTGAQQPAYTAARLHSMYIPEINGHDFAKDWQTAVLGAMFLDPVQTATIESTVRHLRTMHDTVLDTGHHWARINFDGNQL